MDVGSPLPGPQSHLGPAPGAIQSLHKGNPQLSGHDLGQHPGLVVPPHPATRGCRGNGDHNWIPSHWREHRRHPAPHHLPQGTPATILQGVYECVRRGLHDYRRTGGGQDLRPISALQAGRPYRLARAEGNITAEAARGRGRSKEGSATSANEILRLFRGKPVPTTQTPAGQEEVEKIKSEG